MTDYPADDEDRNTWAGASAVSRAEAGDWTLLRERLHDPDIALTMHERRYLAQQGPKRKQSKAREPVLYRWFREAEGMDRAGAELAVCRALGKTTAENADSVRRVIDRAGREDYDPGPIFWRNVQLYREGVRSPAILPEPLAGDVPDLAEYLRTRTD